MEIPGLEHMSISGAPINQPQPSGTNPPSCFLLKEQLFTGAPFYQQSSTHPPARIIPKSDEEILFGLASAAVNYYNSNHQCHFELVDALYMENITYNWSYPVSSYKHLSFIARSKDSSRKLKLFFAEVYCDSGEKTVTCTPVEPGNPLFPLGCGQCHPEGVIYHPYRKYEAGGRRYYNSPPAWKLVTREESAKKILCETYIFKDTVQELYPEEDEELRNIINGYAVEALDWYRQFEEEDFELLEPVACVRFGDRTALVLSELDAVVWVHVTFMARNKDPLCIDASPELFFAELNFDFGQVYICIKMTQASSGSSKSEAETSCEVCRNVCPMFHPEGRYVAGLRGGTFADAQVKDRSWGVKVELLEKVGISSNAAGVQVGKPTTCSSNEK